MKKIQHKISRIECELRWSWDKVSQEYNLSKSSWNTFYYMLLHICETWDYETIYNRLNYHQNLKKIPPFAYFYKIVAKIMTKLYSYFFGHGNFVFPYICNR